MFFFRIPEFFSPVKLTFTHITSNDRPFGSSFIYTAIFRNPILFIDTSTMLKTTMVMVVNWDAMFDDNLKIVSNKFFEIKSKSQLIHKQRWR